MEQRTTLTVLSLALIVLGFASVLQNPVHLELTRSNTAAIFSPNTLPAPSAGSITSLTLDQAITDVTQSDSSLNEDINFLSHLLDRFGANIKSAKIQIRALEQAIGYLKQRYPEDWRFRLPAFLAAAFPGWEDRLVRRAESLLEYNSWLGDESQSLSALSNEERKEKLWTVRMSLFGDEAYEIWRDQWRTERLEETLRDLQEPYTALNEKVELFMSDVREIYLETSQDFAYGHFVYEQQGLSDRFLSVDEIQSQLSLLDPEERYAELRNFRRALGMDETALGRWHELDRLRDHRRSDGQAYMSARQELENSFTGEEFDRAVRELQKVHFNDEASTIYAEEAGGYYRFLTTQLYGLN